MKRSECRYSLAEPDFPAQVMLELAAVDELFQNPRVEGKGTLKGVFEAVDPSVRYVGDTRRANEREESGADRRFMLKTVRGRDIFVHQTDDEVWADISDLEEGDAGSAIYQAIAEYAFNTGRTFIGDPAGLSPIALRRRTEAMLSSALKHGTTEHLAPHPDQVTGDAEIGVPPLRWKSGDHLGNIQAMIDVSVASMKSVFPEIDRARYDFETRTFRDSEGRHLSDEVLDGWASSAGGVREARAGRNTLKRSILLAALSRTQGAEQPGLLERTLRLSHQLVGGGGLRNIFYSSAAGDSPGSAVPELEGWLLCGPLARHTRELLRTGRLRLHQSLSDLPGTGHPANAQAMTDGEGVIHLVADNLHAARAESVVLHEAFHAGARELLGARGWGVLLARMEGLLKTARERRADGRLCLTANDAWWDRALERVEAAGVMRPEEQVEELAAYAIEEIEAAPAGVRGTLARLPDRLKARLLVAIGVQVGEVTPGELREVALQTLANYQSAPDVGRPGSTAAMNSALANLLFPPLSYSPSLGQKPG